MGLRGGKGKGRMRPDLEVEMAEKAIEIVARGACVKDGKLLVCRSVRRGTRYLPGGHVEWGETSAQALEREWREELGVGCEVKEFLGIEEQVYPLDGEAVAEISTIFRVECEGLDGKEAVSAEGHIRFEWVALDALEESGMMPKELRGALKGWLAEPGAAAGRCLSGDG